VKLTQTYQTTIADEENGHSATVWVIPARSLDREVQELLGYGDRLHRVAETFFDAHVEYGAALPYITPAHLALVLGEPVLITNESIVKGSKGLAEFCTQLAYARIIPFESSPLGAESLATLAANSVKAGTVTLGATVGFIAAGKTPLLLITVPLGIVLCGASVSFAKWIEENRTKVWSKMSLFSEHFNDREANDRDEGNDRDRGRKFRDEEQS
jgi:hypothetical protein